MKRNHEPKQPQSPELGTDDQLAELRKRPGYTEVSVSVDDQQYDGLMDQIRCLSRDYHTVIVGGTRYVFLRPNIAAILDLEAERVSVKEALSGESDGDELK